MAIKSAEDLAQRTLSLDLVDEAQLGDVWSEFTGRQATLEQFKQALLRRDLLTFYQMEALLAGKRSGFYYGDYKVLYLVGRGTFARVYRATSREGDRQVAIKVLRHQYSVQPEEADRFYREGEMGARLKHPNIVPIYEVHSQGVTHFMVMEFVEGQNLREFYKVRKVFEPLQAVKLILDVCKGLDYAHGLGVTHRDLKLSNVLITSRGDAKLVDFGLAGFDESAADSGGDDKNPRAIDYAGLERNSGAPRDDPRSDLFFVGCMLYSLLTGRHALSDTRIPLQRLSRARFAEIPSVMEVKPDLPGSVALVVKKAIEFNPDQRYQTAAEMVSELTGLVQRLDQGKVDSGEPLPEQKPTRQEGTGPNGQPRVVMVIEGDTKMQDALRDGLKKKGYRVLVTADPQRALDRFSGEQVLPDLMLFSTGLLGRRALDAYEQLDQVPGARDFPAILLLGEDQAAWAPGNEQPPQRSVLKMPVTFRQLREAILGLLNSTEKA